MKYFKSKRGDIGVFDDNGYLIEIYRKNEPVENVKAQIHISQVNPDIIEINEEEAFLEIL